MRDFLPLGGLPLLPCCLELLLGLWLICLFFKRLLAPRLTNSRLLRISDFRLQDDACYLAYSCSGLAVAVSVVTCILTSLAAIDTTNLAPNPMHFSKTALADLTDRSLYTLIYSPVFLLVDALVVLLYLILLNNTTPILSLTDLTIFWLTMFGLLNLRLALMIKDGSFLMSLSNFLMLVFSFGSAAILLPRFRKTEPKARVCDSLEEPLIAREGKPVSQGDEFAEGLVPRLFFNFVSDMVELIQTSDLRRVSLPVLGQIEDQNARKKFSTCCDAVRGRGHLALGWAIIKWGAAYVTVGTILEGVQTTLQITTPLVLNRILNLLQSKDLYTSAQFRLRGGVLAAMLTAAIFSSSIIVTQYLHVEFRLGCRLRCSLTSTIFYKTLRTNPQRASEDGSSGKVINMMSTDVESLDSAFTTMQNVWSGPIQILVPLYFLYLLLGWPALLCILVFSLTVPLSHWIFAYQIAATAALQKAKDARLQVTGEVLSGIKSVKMYAWERKMLDTIKDLRAEELVKLWNMLLAEALGNMMWSAVPLSLSLLVFGGAFLFTDKVLDAQTVFTAFSLITIMEFPLTFLPYAFTCLTQGITALSRIQNYLNLPDVTPPTIAEDAKVMLTARGLTVGHDEPLIRNLDLTLKEGELLVVVGKVASGKSTLIDTLVGETPPFACELLERTASIGYASQTPWLFTGTARDNILLGEPFDSVRYARVVKACALEDDFKILTYGDQTVIGERGVNLSGGQKQRISLARTVYKDAKLYLLDDVLSAVDAHVAEHITKNVIRDLLKSKAVLLVTHSAVPARFADKILFLSAVSNWSIFTSIADGDGCEEFIEALASAQGGQKADDHARHASSFHGDAAITGGSSSIQKPVSLADKLMAEDTTAENEVFRQGHVPFAVYESYLMAIGGYVIVGLLSLNLGLQEVLSVGSNFWLADWVNHPLVYSRAFGFGVYAAINLLSIAALGFFSIWLAMRALRASKIYHAQLLQRFLYAKSSWLEKMPMGILLNRLSRDLGSVDEQLPMSLFTFVTEVMKVICVLASILIVMPASICILVPLYFVYKHIQEVYTTACRQMRRINSINQAPVTSLFNEVLSGTPVIRALAAERHFFKRHVKDLDCYMQSALLLLTTNRWAAVRLEALGGVIVAFLAFFILLGPFNLNVALAGLVISYSVSFTGSINWMVNTATRLETDVVSVERLTEYLENDNCPQEEVVSTPLQDESWPQTGDIQICAISMRYAPTLPLALNHLQLSVRDKEQLGIVGRTGAGKSSILACLLKMVDIENDGGYIRIGGQNIRQIPPQILRDRIAVIPQDPLMFTGTIRFNLDPFNLYSDDDIWNVLRSTCLYETVSELPDKLQTLVAEKGGNWSVGQRQLFCLARVLLKRVKILLIDEGTSSVDGVTDKIVQLTIRRSFAQCTIITIAHRLQTIWDYDRVAVLQEGKMVEVGPPGELVTKTGGVFRQLAIDAGLA